MNGSFLRPVLLKARLRRFRMEHHLVDPVGRAAYCYIAKNACSTIKYKIIEKHVSNNLIKADPDEIRSNLHGVAKYASLARTRRRIKKDYYVFAVIRRPEARLVSAFIDKFVRSFPPRSFALDLVGHDVEPAEVTFRGFMRALGEAEQSTLNEHWMPQHLHLFPGIRYDLVPFEGLRAHPRLRALYGDLSQNVRNHTETYGETTEAPVADVPVRELRLLRARAKAMPAWPNFFDAALEREAAEMLSEDVALHDSALRAAGTA